jgi:Na+-driven multidrug efflux pump
MIPMLFLFFNLEPILIAFGQDPEVIKYTDEFVLYVLPGQYLIMVSMTYRRWLINLKYTTATTMMVLIAIGCYAVTAYIFVILWDY